MIIEPGTFTHRVVHALRKRANRDPVPTGILAEQAGVSSEGFARRIDRALRHGIIVQHRVGNRLSAWSLGEADCEAKSPVRVPSDGEGNPDVPVSSLRALMFIGTDIEAGDPLRKLADAKEMARRVLAAKPGSRFSGAEVDLLVARELRAISEAAAQACVNLKQALEILQ